VRAACDGPVGLLTSLALPERFSRTRIDVQIALAAGHLTRVRGRSDPEVWAQTIEVCQRNGPPQALAEARYRFAEAVLGAGRRSGGRGRGPARGAGGRSRAPYRATGREIESLAERARIELEESPPAASREPGAGWA